MWPDPKPISASVSVSAETETHVDNVTVHHVDNGPMDNATLKSSACAVKNLLGHTYKNNIQFDFVRV